MMCQKKILQLSLVVVTLGEVVFHHYQRGKVKVRTDSMQSKIWNPVSDLGDLCAMIDIGDIYIYIIYRQQLSLSLSIHYQLPQEI